MNSILISLIKEKGHDCLSIIATYDSPVECPNSVLPSYLCSYVTMVLDFV